MFGMDLKTKSRDKYRQEINTETYLKKKQKQKERIWKKRILQYVGRNETKTKRISKKLSRGVSI